jgi:hypothetical protein
VEYIRFTVLAVDARYPRYSTSITYTPLTAASVVSVTLLIAGVAGRFVQRAVYTGSINRSLCNTR